jgi:hypothetical protein
VFGVDVNLKNVGSCTEELTKRTFDELIENNLVRIVVVGLKHLQGLLLFLNVAWSRWI